MNAPPRPCCRALVVVAICASAVSAAVVAFPGASDVRLFASLPFLCVAWLAPGLLCTPFLAPRATAPERLLLGAGVAYVVQGIATTLARLVGGAPVEPLLTHAIAGAATLSLSARLWLKPPQDVRRRDADDARLLLATLLVLVSSTALFSGALFSDLSSDGVEAFEMGRSLDRFSLPRSPGGDGVVGLGVGMIVQAFSAHWFHGAFPHQDVAPRLPLLLFLPLLFAGVVALAETGGVRRCGRLALAAIGATTLAFGAAFGLSASFDPYHADLSSPAAIDVQAVVLVVGVLHAAAIGSTPRLLLFASLAHLARPTGTLSLLFLLAATPIVAAPGARFRHVTRVAVALATCFLLTFLYERVYAPAATGGAVALGFDSLGSRLRYVSFFDAGRLLWVVLPAGIVAPFAAFRLRSQDRFGRGLALFGLATTALFYFPSAYAPHHFALPAVLCVAAFHRSGTTSPAPRGAAAAFAALALAIAGAVATLPRGGLEPKRPYSEIGRSVFSTAPTPYENLKLALADASALDPLIEPCHAEADPSSVLMGSTLSVARYARRAGSPDASVRFITRVGVDAASGSTSPPPGFVLVASTDDGSLFARSLDDVAAARKATARVDWKAAALDFDRRRLFRHLVVKNRLYDLDLRALLSP